MENTMTAPLDNEVIEEEEVVQQPAAQQSLSLDDAFQPLNEPPEEEGGGFFQEQVVRRGERYLQRGAESIFGLPGDVVQLVRGIAGKLPGGITPEEDLNFVQKYGRKALEALPGSEELRARSAEIKPHLEPKHDYEETEDEIVSDFAALALPVKGKIPFARAIGLSVIGNAGKQAMKEMGFGEGAQEATKLGMILFGGMFGKGRGVKSHINNLYKEAETFIPKGAKLNYGINNMKKYKSQILKGGIDDSKTKALEILTDIEGKLAKGSLPVDEAVAFDKRINRAISQAGKDKSQKGWLDQLKKVHSEGLDDYAKQNPSWGDNWKQAKQAYAGIAKSENIKDYVRKNANLKNLTYAAAALGLEEAALPGHVMAKIGGLGTVATGMYAKEMAKRIATNPALRRYYQNVLTASLTENKAMLSRNLAGLERASKKEFENNPLPEFSFEEDEEINN